MNTISKIFLGISIIFSLFMVSGFLLPASYQISRSVQINAPHSLIYEQINDLKKWPEWTVWNTQTDPSLVLQYGSISVGEGASWQWNAEQMGNGTLKIVKSYPLEGVQYKLSMNEGRMEIDGNIKIEIIDSTQTKVIWLMHGALGNNPVRRYLGLMMNKWLAPDLEQNLEKLKNKIE